MTYLQRLGNHAFANSVAIFLNRKILFYVVGLNDMDGILEAANGLGFVYRMKADIGETS